MLSTANVGRAALATITPVPAAGSILAAAGAAALPSPPRKTRITSHQEQIARQNERKRRAIQGQAHARRITICGPNWTGYPGQKINHTKINRWLPLWSTDQTWDGKAALYVATKNRGKIRRFGGGKAWPMRAGGPFQWVRQLIHLNHTTINLGSAGWGRNRPGDGEVAAFCGVHFFGILAGGFFLWHH
jgi:hypothetical protein